MAAAVFFNQPPSSDRLLSLVTVIIVAGPEDRDTADGFVDGRGGANESDVGKKKNNNRRVPVKINEK